VAELMHSQEPNTPSPRPRYGALFYIGASGLMLAMLVEAVAVIGRQLGVPLLGALEIIQAAILLTASASMLSATLSGSHATVHLIVERLSHAGQAVLRRASFAIASAFFACLAMSAAWLTIEVWNDFEHSELLQIPYRPLRVIVVVMTTAVAVVFAYKAVQRVAKGRTQ
jgi:TRAP-type C4-dicarboxylate transport system permease small subunit